MAIGLVHERILAIVMVCWLVRSQSYALSADVWSVLCSRDLPCRLVRGHIYGMSPDVLSFLYCYSYVSPQVYCVNPWV